MPDTPSIVAAACKWPQGSEIFATSPAGPGHSRGRGRGQAEAGPGLGRALCSVSGCQRGVTRTWKRPQRQALHKKGEAVEKHDERFT